MRSRRDAVCALCFWPDIPFTHVAHFGSGRIVCGARVAIRGNNTYQTALAEDLLSALGRKGR